MVLSITGSIPRSLQQHSCVCLLTSSTSITHAQGEEDADLLENEYGDDLDDDYGIDHYASDGDGGHSDFGGGDDGGEATF